MNKVKRKIICSFLLAAMLVSAPYFQAYAAQGGKEGSLEEKPADLYLAFTRSREAAVQGFGGMSRYVAYAKEVLGRSEKLAKQGYCYSSQGIRYSYEKGKDGLDYYAKIPNYAKIPVLKETAENIARFRTVLPVLPQNDWLAYLENLTPRAAAEFDNALNALEVAGTCSEQNPTSSIAGFPAALPLLAQSQWLN